MPFEGSYCDRCGALTKYDAKARMYYCEHCGAIDYKKDIFNHYTTNISDLHVDGLQFDTEMTVEMKMRLKAAEASITLGKYEDALRRFRLLSDDIPQEYRVWWGQIRAKTRELTVDVENRAELTSLCALYDSMMHFVPVKDRDEIEQRFMAYIRLQEERLEQRIQELQSREEELQEEEEDLQIELMKWRQSSYESSEQSLNITWTVFAVALGLGILGKSWLLIAAAAVGLGYCYLVLGPDMKKKESDWITGKQERMDELTQQSKLITQELEQIAKQLKKLTA